MYVAARYCGTPDKSSQNSGNMCALARSLYNVAEFRRDPTKILRDIRCRKSVPLRAEKYTKVHQNPLRLITAL